MWLPLVNHLEESRIYERQERPFLCLKKQTKTFSGRVIVSYPFSAEGILDFSKKGFDKATFHEKFAPNVPLHIGLKSDGSFVSNLNFKIKKDQTPKYLQSITFNMGLFGNIKSYMSAVVGLRYHNIASLSLSINPFILGATYHGEKFGGEISYSFPEDQPAASLLYHNKKHRTQMSFMGSMYGAVSALITSDLDKFRISSYFEANVFSFDSKAAFGIQIPFMNSFSNLSIALPSKVITFEVALNREDDTTKQGVTMYLPIDFKSINNKPK